MIKEKDTYSLSNDFPVMGGTRYWDEDEVITVEYVKGVLEEAFERTGLDASVFDEILSYKTGLLSSEQMPCLLIKNNEKGDKWRRIVVVVRRVGVQTSIVPAWYGESKSDKNLKKIEKNYERSARDSQRLQDQYEYEEKHGIGSWGSDYFSNASNALAKKGFRAIKNVALNAAIKKNSVGESDFYTLAQDSIEYAFKVITAMMNGEGPADEPEEGYTTE